MIRKINKITNYGIFQGFRWPADGDLAEFKEKNVLYGWNWSGKSTIAAMFHLLEIKRIDNKYTEIPDFKIELTNGSKISQDNLVDSPLVRVFDRDYVDKNFTWTGDKKGKVKAIFFLGKENIQLSNELEEKKEEIEKINDRILTNKNEFDNMKSAFDKWKYTLANRTIKDTLNTGSGDQYANYDIRKMESRISNTPNIDSYKIEDENAIIGLRKNIRQHKTEFIKAIDPPVEIDEFINDSNSVLRQTAISKSLARLQDEKETENWAKIGLKLHKQNQFKICKFCARPLTKEIIQELEEHFNEGYLQLDSEIESQKIILENSKLNIDLPKNSELDSELISQFEALRSRMDICIKSFNEIIGELESRIKNKTPLEKVPDYLTDKKNEKYLQSKNINSIILKVNMLISEHNKKVDNFDKEIKGAKEKIELSIIANNIKEYLHYQDRIENISSEISSLNSKISNIEKRVTEIEANLSDGAKAAGQINRYLKDYFGRDEIQIEFSEQEKGFSIKRHSNIADNLSEGEKNGISLIYFLTKLEEKNFNKSKCIVVIDDPVSSLDSNSIYFAFAFLQEKLKDVHQLFILTHDFYLLRQVNNWFYQINRKKPKKAEHFMIDCYWEDETRKAKIKPLDKLLINYKSEYQYLLKLLFDLYRDNEPNLEKVYNYPNITRKFLELFLSFKYPAERSRVNPIPS
jgi:wobble nucleotide-excising tRNase